MKNCILILSSMLIFSGCSPLKKTQVDKTPSTSTDATGVFAKKIYNPSETLSNDLLHTKLDVRFDWEKAHLLGKATLTLKPWFYPTSRLELDAKGFDIHKIAFEGTNGQTPLDYKYENDIISISLGKQFTRNDTFSVYIEYTAKPNELQYKGSQAIRDAKGLYFINPDGTEKGKPRQVWTQGETESSSCWFPTIDVPNEKMTQEIYITTDTGFVTLSNGLLIYSTNNGDGTRTDYWKQNLPHAPYLAMMAVGKYAIVKDKWRDIEVDYYVEPEYEQYARMIFGNTPEMLEFYSKKLGYDYPWEKFHQVVVRDYVSGAMENTSTVIYGEFIQRDEGEYQDETSEETIAHELFHHWFGDLLTCESWANLPLNESFATYGEYLWVEYKYGIEEADYHINGDLRNYLWEAKAGKQVNLIRYDYDDKEDMFDSHSYAKGGRVLHMLRKIVGDDAFFEALKNYLHKNAYSAVEIADLRMAFEKVTGEDMQWFFNQWFLNSGHPQLNITYYYNDTAKQQVITVSQNQDLTTTPLYKLPVNVDIYANGKVERHKIVIEDKMNHFEFYIPAKPDLVNFDAEKMLLCEKTETKTNKEWEFQYYNCPLYLDRYEALKELSTDTVDPLAAKVLQDALNDKFWQLNVFAMTKLRKPFKNEKQIKNTLTSLAKTSAKSDVRSKAVYTLSMLFDDKDLADIYKGGIKDKSYSVISESMWALSKSDSAEAVKIAKTLELIKSSSLTLAIAGIYAQYGSEKERGYFIGAYTNVNSYEKLSFASIYADYMMKQQNDDIINEGLPLLEEIATASNSWWIRLAVFNKIKKILAMYEMSENAAKEELKTNKENSESIKKSETAKKQKETISKLLISIKDSETDARALRFMKL